MKIQRRKLALIAGVIAVIAALSGARTVQSQNDPQAELDVVYGEAAGQQLKLDAFRPLGDGAPRPALVFVHGGGWSGGDKADFRDLAKGATNAGYVSFSVGYRLAKPDANKYPAQIDDVQRAIRWIRHNAKKYNIDPNRIGALGASAGGHLVALLGTRETRDNSDKTLANYSSRVNCVVDMFGPTDFTLKDENISPEGGPILLNFIGKTPQEAPETYRDASPITHISKDTVPFLIFHGDQDTLVPPDQSQRFHNALQKAKIDSKLIIFEGEGHGFAKPENQQRFITESLAFFQKHLNP